MKRNHFPIFMELNEGLAIIVGGGAVAERRVKTLMKFNFKIRVISPELTDELHNLKNCGAFEYFERKFKPQDLKGAMIVVAATNKREINKIIADEAKASDIPVSIADDGKSSTFWFPAIVVNDDFIVGMVGNGRDHKKLSSMAKRIGGMIENENFSGIEGE